MQQSVTILVIMAVLLFIAILFFAHRLWVRFRPRPEECMSALHPDFTDDTVVLEGYLEPTELRVQADDTHGTGRVNRRLDSEALALGNELPSNVSHRHIEERRSVATQHRAERSEDRVDEMTEERRRNVVDDFDLLVFPRSQREYTPEEIDMVKAPVEPVDDEQLFGLTQDYGSSVVYDRDRPERSV